MLNTINISHVFVFDQQKALDFYVGKLGLEVSNDTNLGFMRWLTVRAAGDPSHDILLEVPAPPGMDEKSAEKVRELIAKYQAQGLVVESRDNPGHFGYFHRVVSGSDTFRLRRNARPA